MATELEILQQDERLLMEEIESEEENLRELYADLRETRERIEAEEKAR